MTQELSPASPVTRSSGTLAAHHRTALGRSTLGDQLRRHAANQPAKAAFIAYAADGSRTAVTYGELNRMANRAAHVLAGLGVSRGDRVAVLARNRVDVVAAYYGALKLGAAFTVVNPMLKAHEMRAQLGHAEPRVLLSSHDLLALARSAAGPSAGEPALAVTCVDLDGDGGPDGWPSFTALASGTGDAGDAEPDAEVDELDVAMLVYTSGTESAPKGVLIPHRNYLTSTAPAWSWGLRTGHGRHLAVRHAVLHDRRHRVDDDAD